MKRLLFFSLEAWDQVWRRNQFICRELLTRHPDLEILWINPVVDVRLGTAQSVEWIANSSSNRVEAGAGVQRLSVFQPLKTLPNLVGHGFNFGMIRSHLLSLLKQRGWDEFAVWVNDQSMRNILPLPGATKIIYDITDDWTQASLTARQRQRVERDDAWFLQNADAVIVCSPKLVELKQAQAGRKLYLVPNGIDYERFSPEQLAKLNPPPAIEKLPAPIAGYTGSLHEDRLDVPMVVSVAEALPAVQFVFVGPDYLSEDSKRSLSRLANCHILGATSYDSLPSYVSRFSLCIAPHKVNAFTESLDPLKLYEYMATGKPIVATPCAGFRQLDGLVRLAQNTPQFVTAITDVIGSADEKSTERTQWASQFSWQRRADEVERILADIAVM